MQKPKLFSIIKHYKKELSAKQVRQDIVSGIIVAIIALPLSIALGIASGVTPEKGLITAIIAGFLISFLGGSRVQIGGPTAAFVVIVSGIVEKHGVVGLTISTVMAGIILLLAGVLKFGSIIKFIPYPIIIGFTSGIAVTLFSTQVKDLLGLTAKNVPSEFIEKWIFYFQNVNHINLPALLLGILCVFIIIFWTKINKVIPGSLVALVLATLAVNIFRLPIETIGSRFGQLSSDVPMPIPFYFNISMIKELIQPSITIAILAGIESLLSAVVADGMIGKKHNSNMELIAQGVANIGSAIFGGIPATGAIARTAANVKSGGRTPIAGVTHAIVLFLILILLMPYAKLIPMTALSAILIVVSYNMSEWKSFKSLLRSPKSDVSVMIITFTLTVVFDLVIAISVGMMLAMFLFIKNMSESTLISRKTNIFSQVSYSDSDNTDSDFDSDDSRHIPEHIMVYEINGPLFFGVANTFIDIVNQISNAKILVLRMHNVPIMDATAFNSVKQLRSTCEKQNILLVFSEVQKQPTLLLKQMGFINSIGRERFFKSYDDALVWATNMHIEPTTLSS